MAKINRITKLRPKNIKKIAPSSTNIPKLTFRHNKPNYYLQNTDGSISEGHQ